MHKYTCFVVSPIGAKGSEPRKLADDLFELLIEPALEKFGFLVTRADKISSVSSITSDIIEQLQNSDLCIIDITGHNPNVMYECGRRHETGKPYIMVAREGEILPFDITTIRTFFYNLEKPREILATKNALQETVGRMLEAGFRSDASGDSLASVVDLLRRIERKIDAMPMAKTAVGAVDLQKHATAKELVKRLGLGDAFVYAKSQADGDLIDAIIPMMQKRWGEDKRYMINIFETGALQGSRVAFENLEKLFPLDETYSDDDRIEAISCYVSGAFSLGESERAIKVFDELYGDLTTTPPPVQLNPDQRSILLNQYQRLLYSLERYRDASIVGGRVLELNPTDRSYLYNQVLNFRALGEDESALNMTERLMSEIAAYSGTPDADHLKVVVKVFAKAQRLDRFRDAFNMLQKVDEYVAQVVRESDEVRPMLRHI